MLLHLLESRVHPRPWSVDVTAGEVSVGREGLTSHMKNQSNASRSEQEGRFC